MSAHLLGRTGRATGIDAPLGELSHIGADPANEVCLALEGVSRRHARVWLQAPDYWIEDLRSTNGTYLNGQRVSRERLRHLDVITLGRDVDVIFIETTHSAPGDAPAVLSASLTWRDGERAGETIELQRGETTLGRAAANAVILDHSAISKVHLRLQLTSDQLLVEDLASANGTFVNGQRLSGAMPLETGDIVSLAGTANFEVTVQRRRAAAPISREATTEVQPVFDNDWKTRLVWSPEELERIEAERDRAVREAEELFRGQGAAPGEQAPAAETPAAPQEVPPVVGPAVQQAPSSAPFPGEPARPTTVGEPIVGGVPKAVAAEAEVPNHVARPTAVDSPGVAVPQFLPTSAGNGSGDPMKRAGQIIPGTIQASGGAAPVPPEVIEGAKARPDVAGPATANLARGPVTGIVLIGTSTQYALECGEHVLGRGVECTLRIDSPDVSRRHARLVVRPAGVEIEDLGSPNGTLVNGRKTTGMRALQADDIVTLGSRTFKLEIVRAGGRAS